MEPRKLILPDPSLVVLVGASGCGKSTFARRHFRPTEVLSSDFFRALVCDNEADQSASKDAFELLHQAIAKRLARRRLTVVDATSVLPDGRRQLLDLAQRYHTLAIAIVFDVDADVCLAFNQQRQGRIVPPAVIQGQLQQLRRAIGMLPKEGFTNIFTLRSPEEIETAVVERRPLWCDRRSDHGPFDLIGDVHGCYDELLALLGKLGYQVEAAGQASVRVQPPPGRKAIFIGDLVDRGPKVPEVLRLVMGMVEAGTALCIVGNHDDKLLRYVMGRKVKVAHGLAETLRQLEPEPDDFKQHVMRFLDELISHYVLDDGKLVVAHAGLREDLQGRASRRVRDFALYGDTTGETDDQGLPVRLDWAAEYRGAAEVVYGHTPVAEPHWVNRTLNIDTGCVFGGRLTALRYPEKELVSVPALRQYWEPARPFLPDPTRPDAGRTPQQQADDLLDLADVAGKRVVETSLCGRVTLREENSAAALETMSRFAADPHWLIYLPPTMSPCETSQQPGLLEHPAEAFAYLRSQGVERVVCEEKHMGSRAVVVVCRDADAARRRFGVAGGAGIIYTRTGRRFFEDALEAALLDHVRRACTATDLWGRLNTDWLCLDCELMPWSAKAQELLKQQYAPAGAAARAALVEVNAVLAQAAMRGLDVASLAERHGTRAEAAAKFTEAYRRYCWPVQSVSDLRLAPFHLLATEGAVHSNRDHLWHLEQAAALVAAGDGILHGTRSLVVDVNDPASVEAGTRWWDALTAAGGEGMVVKPLAFVVRGQRGLVQPAVKCRGREYLRIIYGPEYTAPEHLERLRVRGLSTKRGLALREFALGIEALERFVRREPLRRVHECCFAVLALESEPVDPRL